MTSSPSITLHELAQLRSYDAIRLAIGASSLDCFQLSSRITQIISARDQSGTSIQAATLHRWMFPPEMGLAPDPFDGIPSQELTPEQQESRRQISARNAYVTKTIDPLHKIDQLVKATRCLLPLQWLAAQFNGFFILKQEVYRKPESLHLEWIEVWTRLVQVRVKVKEEYQDDRRIDRDEAASIAMEWLRIKGWIEGLMLIWEHEAGVLRREHFVEGRKIALGDLERSLFRLPPHIPIHVATNEMPFDRGSLARDMGISERTLDNLTSEPSETSRTGTGHPLNWIVYLIEATKSQLPLNWLFSRHAGFFYRDPLRIVDAADRDLAWEQAFCEMAELDAALNQAVLARTPVRDVQKLRKEWDDVKVWMRTFLRTHLAPE